MIKFPKDILSFDTETTGVNPYGDEKTLGFFPARPYFFSFTNINGESMEFRFNVDPKTRKVIYTSREVRLVNDILGNNSLKKIGHNIAFDILMSQFADIYTFGEVEDTLMMAHILTGGSEISYGLKQLSKKFLDFSDQDEVEVLEATKKARREGKKNGWKVAEGKLFGKDPVKCDMWMAPRYLLSKYGCSDTERTMLLYLNLEVEIRKNPGMLATYNMEKELFPIIRQAERCGVCLFPEKLNEIDKFYKAYRDKWTRVADKEGGKNLNFNSPLQLQKLFYTQKKYEILKRTKASKTSPNGNPSTDGETLEYFWNRYQDKLAKAILEVKGASSMLKSFVEPYQRFKVKDLDNFILHPNYRQVGPETGRMACGDPNLMNVAAKDSPRKKSEVDLRIRECLGPRKGHFWLMPDYSQIEVWVLAFRSGENDLKKILLSGTDFHEGISNIIWGKEKDYATNKTAYRKRAKNINFCKIYGGGPKKVAQMIGCSLQDAYKFVDDYNKKNPAIQRYMNRTSNKMIQQGFIENAFGRHYFIPEDFAYRATNYDTQGTAADIFKRACINLGKMNKQYPGMEQLLFIHDEWAIEFPLKYMVKKTVRDVVKCLQGDFHKVIGCPIPLPVGMKIVTTNWAEAREVKWVKDEWESKYICKKTH